MGLALRLLCPEPVRRGQHRRAWIAGLFAACVTILGAGEAEASGIEGCFRESQSFAMCNGFIAGLAGLGSMSGPILALVDSEAYGGGGLIAASVALGIYSGASGAALVASSQGQDPMDSSTRDSGMALGTVGLVAGGSGLILSAVAGIALALRGDDGEELGALGGLTVGAGVTGAAGVAPGLTVRASF